MRSVRDLKGTGHRALVRVDFNVPLTPDGHVADALRIEEFLPTLRALIDQGARTILMSHLGRPKGKDPALSLRPVAGYLSQRLGRPVRFAPDCIGPETQAASAALDEGEVLLLENLRFHAEEEANDPDFARALSSLGDVFVEDAFGTVHRAHASTVGVPKVLPAYAGFLVEREVAELSKLTQNPERPYAAVIGGAKIRDKLPLLKNLLRKVDALLLGGALGASVITDSQDPSSPLFGAVRELTEQAQRSTGRLVLPEDFILQEGALAPARVSEGTRIPAGSRAMDIGPRTCERFRAELASARTVFANGPLGKAEEQPFAQGTREVLGHLGLPGQTSILAGGDTAGIIRSMGLAGAFTYISTGGGAALEFIEGRELPGLAVIPPG